MSTKTKPRLTSEDIEQLIPIVSLGLINPMTHIEKKLLRERQKRNQQQMKKKQQREERENAVVEAEYEAAKKTEEGGDENDGKGDGKKTTKSSYPNDDDDTAANNNVTQLHQLPTHFFNTLREVEDARVESWRNSHQAIYIPEAELRRSRRYVYSSKSPRERTVQEGESTQEEEDGNEMKQPSYNTMKQRPSSGRTYTTTTTSMKNNRLTGPRRPQSASVTVVPSNVPVGAGISLDLPSSGGTPIRIDDLNITAGSQTVTPWGKHASQSMAYSSSSHHLSKTAPTTTSTLAHPTMSVPEAQQQMASAMQAISCLSKANITEIQSFRNPPAVVERVLNAVMICLQVVPNLEDGTAGKGGVRRYEWRQILHEINRRDVLFFNRLQTINSSNRILSSDGKKEEMEEVLEYLAPYVSHPSFRPDGVGNVSKAAQSFCVWVRAVANALQAQLRLRERKDDGEAEATNAKEEAAQNSKEVEKAGSENLPKQHVPTDTTVAAESEKGRQEEGKNVGEQKQEEEGDELPALSSFDDSDKKNIAKLQAKFRMKKKKPAVEEAEKEKEKIPAATDTTPEVVETSNKAEVHDSDPVIKNQVQEVPADVVLPQRPTTAPVSRRPVSQQQSSSVNTSQAQAQVDPAPSVPIISHRQVNMTSHTVPRPSTAGTKKGGGVNFPSTQPNKPRSSLIQSTALHCQSTLGSAIILPLRECDPLNGALSEQTQTHTPRKRDPFFGSFEHLSIRDYLHHKKRERFASYRQNVEERIEEIKQSTEENAHCSPPRIPTPREYNAEKQRKEDFENGVIHLALPTKEEKQRKDRMSRLYDTPSSSGGSQHRSIRQRPHTAKH